MISLFSNVLRFPPRPQQYGHSRRWVNCRELARCHIRHDERSLIGSKSMLIFRNVLNLAFFIFIRCVRHYCRTESSSLPPGYLSVTIRLTRTFAIVILWSGALCNDSNRDHHLKTGRGGRGLSALDPFDAPISRTWTDFRPIPMKRPRVLETNL